MERLPLSSTEAEILDALYRWVQLLASAHYAQALELTYRPPHSQWTPELLEHVIATYGSADPDAPRRDHRITVPTPKEAFAVSSRFDIHQSEAGAWVEIDLWLDHQPSDLTATFDLTPLGDFSVLVLDDIHVL